LELALETARQKFATEHKLDNIAALQVIPASPINEAGLQVVDYFLWALQRTFERNEDRFLELIQSKCSLIIDIDDKREKPYGTYYTKEKPLSAAVLVGRRI